MDPIEVMERVVGEERLPCPEGCPREIYDLMMKLWSRDLHQRPSFDEIAIKLNDVKIIQNECAESNLMIIKGFQITNATSILISIFKRNFKMCENILGINPK